MKTSTKNRTLALTWVGIVMALVLAAFTVANAQTTAITTQMEAGDSGAQVSALQTFLAADSAVYPEGLVTGYYGDLTVAAVQRYQCKNGIVCQGDAATTGYGRVGPSTLAKIQIQLGTNPGGGGTNFPPTGADVRAPVIGVPTVTTSSNSATVLWATNEPVYSSVLYALAPPALNAESFAAMASVSDITFDMSSSGMLTGLLPNTTYYYVLKSTDASGNIQYSIDHWFRTNL